MALLLAGAIVRIGAWRARARCRGEGNRGQARQHGANVQRAPCTPARPKPGSCAAPKRASPAEPACCSSDTVLTMKGRWPGSYSDAHRCEPITIVADGRVLTMELLGVTFSGSDFDDLAPSAPVDAGAGLILQHGALCSCVLTWEMPVSLHGTSPDTAGVLDCRLTLGAPAAHGGLEREDLELSLRWNDSRMATSTSHGLFETALAEIQRQLPAGTSLKACISCALSDYSPAGNGLFGTLACFRGNQRGYLQVRSKQDIFGIWPTLTEYVPETYLCPHYQRRGTHPGYRGGFPDP